MKIRNVPRTAAAAMLVIFTAAAGLLSCSDSESRVPFGQMATVVINLNLPAEHPTAMNDSIWNTIRRLFVRDAVAQSAPAMFSQINVRVTGPDMGAVEQQFSPYAQISMSVPAGSFRQVEVTAYVAPGDPSAALSFRGSAVANLPAGQTVSVPVVMGLGETKILIPDKGVYMFGPVDNSRIVSINDMTGSSWLERNYTFYGMSSYQEFSPNDIDFDTRGRIYVASTWAVEPYNYIYRYDNMNDNTRTNIGDTGLSGVLSIAIDRKRNFVYYLTGQNNISRCNYDGTNNYLYDNIGSFPWTVFDTVRGIAVDQSSGMLYVAYNNNIIKFNPFTETTLQNVTNLTISGASWDVLVKSDYVYVACNNPWEPLDDKIIQFDLALSTQLNILHEKPGVPAGTNPLLGPHRFLAINNARFYVIDEKEEDSDNASERIVSFIDISGAGWQEFKPSDIGKIEFAFYGEC